MTVEAAFSGWDGASRRRTLRSGCRPRRKVSQPERMAAHSLAGSSLSGAFWARYHRVRISSTLVSSLTVCCPDHEVSEPYLPKLTEKAIRSSATNPTRSNSSEGVGRRRRSGTCRSPRPTNSRGCPSPSCVGRVRCLRILCSSLAPTLRVVLTEVGGAGGVSGSPRPPRLVHGAARHCFFNSSEIALAMSS